MLLVLNFNHKPNVGIISSTQSQTFFLILLNYRHRNTNKKAKRSGRGIAEKLYQKQRKGFYSTRAPVHVFNR